MFYLVSIFCYKHKFKFCVKKKKNWYEKCIFQTNKTKTKSVIV